MAGKRGGLVGDRGALWWQFHRLVAECRPRWVVGENVPGLLSSNGGRDFGTIVGSLVQLGYGVCWRILDAQYFGVAQRRRRVFIVGHSGGIPRPEVLAFAEGVSGHPAPSRETGKNVAPTLGSRTKGGGGLGTDALHAGQTPAVAFNPYRTLNPDGSVTSGYGSRPVTDALHTGSGNKAPLVVKPAVRHLTPLECERLQGFPDNWSASQSDTQRYRQMGNAVAVPVAEWIGKQLVKAE